MAKHLEPPALGLGRWPDRASRACARWTTLGTVRGAVELDLAEAVDGAVSAARMKSRNPSEVLPIVTTSSRSTRRRLVDTFAVDGQAVLGRGVDGDRDGPVLGDVDLQVGAGDRRVADDDVAGVASSQEERAAVERGAVAGVGSLQDVDADGPDRASAAGAGGGAVGSTTTSSPDTSPVSPTGRSGSSSSPVRVSSRRGAAPGPASPRWSAMSAARRAAGASGSTSTRRSAWARPGRWTRRNSSTDVARPASADQASALRVAWTCASMALRSARLGLLGLRRGGGGELADRR